MIALLRTPWGAVSGASVIAVVAALALGALAGAWLAAAPAALAVVGLTAALALHPRPAPMTPQGLIDKVMEQAASGRKLVIYERETGLFAHWYLVLRGEEECNRATRYGRSLSLVVIEPMSPDNAWGIKDELAAWVARNLRATDVAGYFGNGRYVVLMPETTPGGVQSVLDRITTEIPGVTTASSDFGEDGTTYDELYARASAQLAIHARAA